MSVRKYRKGQIASGLGDDPGFAAKAADVIGLYMAPPENAIVICVWAGRSKRGPAACGTDELRILRPADRPRQRKAVEHDDHRAQARVTRLLTETRLAAALLRRTNPQIARRVNCGPRVVAAGIGGTSVVAASQAGREVLTRNGPRRCSWLTLLCMLKPMPRKGVIEVIDITSGEEPMIARIWHGYARPEHADAYEALLKPELLPGIGKVDGYKGSYLLKRPLEAEVEFITITLFDSIDAVRAIAGPDYETAVVPEERRKYLSRFDVRAAHYEIASIHGIAQG
jgi:heme-degrading monooxygenase HmoA